jgi:hypothetical protein
MIKIADLHYKKDMVMVTMLMAWVGMVLFSLSHFKRIQQAGNSLLPVNAISYYIDANKGNDENNGLSSKSPWKSLKKLNSKHFQPGDKILFKVGGLWTGQFAPHGSGSPGLPIVVAQYGKGNRPLINGNGLSGQGVVYLSNQCYWEINDLEIIDDAAEEGDRRGVEVTAANYGLINHIWLRNLDIHHIKGRVGHNALQKRTSGIYITVTSDDTLTRYDDVLIENCKIHDVQNQGIVINNEVSGGTDYPGTAEWERRKITHLIVRGNTLHHISKNAMIIRLADGGLVEHNLCYETALGITGNTIFSRSCKGTVFQYNEGYLNRSPDYDGSLYDADLSSPGTIWQYSYSHDNAHGLMWFCTTKQDSGIVVRYNISQNDKGNLVYFNYAFAGATVYNNVFYIGENLHPTIMIENLKNSHHYGFFNNIIYNLSGKAQYKFATNNDKARQEREISNNLFYGIHPIGEPADNEKIIADPMFTGPGQGKYGVNTLLGYRLKAGSPALKKGKLVSQASSTDFYGNHVLPSEIPNIGCYNGAGLK